ncbi:hypothetical protein PSPO01_15014 [Paraphaeosphaeria sporulosa]
MRKFSRARRRDRQWTTEALSAGLVVWMQPWRRLQVIGIDNWCGEPEGQAESRAAVGGAGRAKTWLEELAGSAFSSFKLPAAATAGSQSSSAWKDYGHAALVTVHPRAGGILAADTTRRLVPDEPAR